jgi:hypothetical protein
MAMGVSPLARLANSRGFNLSTVTPPPANDRQVISAGRAGADWAVLAIGKTLATVQSFCLRIIGADVTTLNGHCIVWRAQKLRARSSFLAQE